MYKLNIYLLSGLLLLAGCTGLALPANPVFNVIDGSGTAATETREVQGIDRLLLTHDAELVLTQDGSETLLIEADDNILEALESSVLDGLLTIGVRDRTNLRPVTPIRYLLSVANLSELTVNGDGIVTAGAFESSNLSISIEGNGRVTLDTITDSGRLLIDIDGDGNAAVTSVIADAVSLSIDGDGDVSISDLQAQSLTTGINGDGRIVVAGAVNDQTITINGDGRLEADQLSSSSADADINGSSTVMIRVSETLDIRASGDGTITYAGDPTVELSINGDVKVNKVDAN